MLGLCLLQVVRRVNYAAKLGIGQQAKNIKELVLWLKIISGLDRNLKLLLKE
uniref:Protein TOPLESS n=1 Tax=Rhizophora mucronata TaxID=61149 RepID=A0A2P2JLA3_RHIMU